MAASYQVRRELRRKSLVIREKKITVEPRREPKGEFRERVEKEREFRERKRLWAPGAASCRIRRILGERV